MAGCVQDFVTLRIGSLWLDVPLGPIQASNSASSLRTTAASPAMTGHEQEVNSASQGDFTPVVSKAAKRRARRAAAKARKVASEKHTTNVRKAASPHSALPSSSKPKVNKPSIHKMELRSHRPTLGEWPVRVRPTSPTKQVQPYAPSSSVLKIKEMTPTSVPSKTLGGCPLKPALSMPGASTPKTPKMVTPNKSVGLSG